MAKNHAPSLIFSIIVHLLAALLFYAIYQAATSFTKKKIEETPICVSLKSYKIEKVQKKELHKEKIVKKTIPKQVPPKKIIDKKAPKKIVRKIIKKPKTKVIEKTIQIKKPIAKVSKTVSPVVEQKKEKTVPKKEIVSTSEIKTTQKVEKKSPEKEYVDNHLQTIQKLLQDNLYYPRRARKRGIVGTVVVHFEINKDGEVTEVKALSSQSEILSRAAVKTIEDLSGKFPKPHEKLFLKIPIVYSLK